MPRNLFYTNKEKDLFISLNKELLGEIIQQEIYYYAINVKDTNANIYGESDIKTYKQPIKFWALVQFERPLTSYEVGQVEREYSIKVKFLRRYLEESNRDCREGDIIQFGNILYEIYNVSGPKLIVGQPSQEWDILVEAKSTRKNVVDLKIM